MNVFKDFKEVVFAICKFKLVGSKISENAIQIKFVWVQLCGSINLHKVLNVFEKKTHKTNYTPFDFPPASLKNEEIALFRSFSVVYSIKYRSFFCTTGNTENLV